MDFGWPGGPLRLQACGPRFISRSRLIRNSVRSIKPRRTLDIGCGRGLVTRILAELSDYVVATDTSEQAVDVTRRYLGTASNALVQAVDVFESKQTVEEWHESFDLVVLSEVLEHIEDDERALGTVRQLLATQGWLLLTVPADPGLWNKEDETVGHYRRYTRQELNSKLVRNGFRVVRITNWGFPVTKLLYLLEVHLLFRGNPRHSEGKGPVRLTTLFKLFRPLFSFLAAVESVFSRLDKGIGYVVLARKTSSQAGR